MGRTGKVVVAVKSAASTGSGGLNRYISESKLDREREQLEPDRKRELFTAHEDDLTYRRADKVLSFGMAGLNKEDVVQLIVSLTPSDFEHLGRSLGERKKSFKEAIRAAMKAAEVAVGARLLTWDAGIHLNTDNPHAHIALARKYLTRNDRMEYMSHVPRMLLKHRETGPDGAKVLVSGTLAEVIERHVEHNRLPSRHIFVEDRESALLISRELLDPRAVAPHAPTSAELAIGRWVVAEVKIARVVALSRLKEKQQKLPGHVQKTVDSARDHLNSPAFAAERRERDMLREIALGFDREAFKNGVRLEAAYIGVEDLKRLEASGVGTLTVLCGPARREDVPVTQTRVMEARRVEETFIQNLMTREHAHHLEGAPQLTNPRHEALEVSAKMEKDILTQFEAWHDVFDQTLGRREKPTKSVEYNKSSARESSLPIPMVTPSVAQAADILDTPSRNRQESRDVIKQATGGHDSQTPADAPAHEPPPASTNKSPAVEKQDAQQKIHERTPDHGRGR